jgi:sporulation protein YlmC with PRC-barrel domain
MVSGTDQRRASKFIGSNVVNLAGDTVGDINELLIDKEGYVTLSLTGSELLFEVFSQLN